MNNAYNLRVMVRAICDMHYVLVLGQARNRYDRLDVEALIN